MRRLRCGRCMYNCRHACGTRARQPLMRIVRYPDAREVAERRLRNPLKQLPGHYSCRRKANCMTDASHAVGAEALRLRILADVQGHQKQQREIGDWWKWKVRRAA
jgi:hypothetical protein